MLTDESVMYSGKYKGQRFSDIPASYFIFIYENNVCSPAVREYIQNNLETLKAEEAFKKKHTNR